MFRLTTAAVTLCLALGLAGAAHAQDEIIPTRPTTIREADIPAAPPPDYTQVKPASEIEASADAYVDSWLATLADPAYARSQRVFVNDTPIIAEPVPDWALEEPVRYVAEMCRPGARPEGEEIEACFTRVEHAVNEARRAAEAALRDRAPRRACSQQTRRSQDGAMTSSSYICTTGEGDPAQMEALLFGD